MRRGCLAFDCFDINRFNCPKGAYCSLKFVLGRAHFFNKYKKHVMNGGVFLFFYKDKCSPANIRVHTK